MNIKRKTEDDPNTTTPKKQKKEELDDDPSDDGSDHEKTPVNQKPNHHESWLQIQTKIKKMKSPAPAYNLYRHSSIEKLKKESQEQVLILLRPCLDDIKDLVAITCDYIYAIDTKEKEDWDDDSKAKVSIWSMAQKWTPPFFGLTCTIEKSSHDDRYNIQLSYRFSITLQRDLVCQSTQFQNDQLSVSVYTDTDDGGQHGSDGMLISDHLHVQIVTLDSFLFGFFEYYFKLNPSMVPWHVKRGSKKKRAFQENRADKIKPIETIGFSEIELCNTLYTGTSHTSFTILHPQHVQKAYRVLSEGTEIAISSFVLDLSDGKMNAMQWELETLEQYDRHPHTITYDDKMNYLCKYCKKTICKWCCVRVMHDKDYVTCQDCFTGRCEQCHLNLIIPEWTLFLKDLVSHEQVLFYNTSDQKEPRAQCPRCFSSTSFSSSSSSSMQTEQIDLWTHIMIPHEYATKHPLWPQRYLQLIMKKDTWKQIVNKINQTDSKTLEKEYECGSGNYEIYNVNLWELVKSAKESECLPDVFKIRDQLHNFELEHELLELLETDSNFSEWKKKQHEYEYQNRKREQESRAHMKLISEQRKKKLSVFINNH